jgi:8-oxo-dGTP pyrophosphatase MutT (NUDIX family)
MPANRRTLGEVRTKPVSCGTLVINPSGQLLLCHLTGTRYWDVPKGLQDIGEAPLRTAMRELLEETGLVFDAAQFVDLGEFDYRPDKRLHLFRVRLAEDPGGLEKLVCTSHFVHRITGASTPEVDAFRWATRDDVPQLCGPRMSRRLTELEW